MAVIGKRNNLVVLHESKHGLFLKAEPYGEVLLPNKYVPEDIEPGDEVDVFLYLDSSDRLIATTQVPLVEVGDFALLTVKSVEKVGAFLDWGLDKDLLLPFGEQKGRAEAGQKVFVRVSLDPQTERIVASARLNRYLKSVDASYQAEDKVAIQVVNRSDLGYNVIVDGNSWGLIFDSEASQPLHRGAKLVGYIKEQREDGKLTISLQRSGYQRVGDSRGQVVQALESSGGFIPLHDKSDPDEIREVLHMSKKTFKQILGALYREGLIEMEPEGVRLKGFSDDS